MSQKFEKTRLDILENKLDALRGCIDDLESLYNNNSEKIKRIEEKLK